MYWVFKHAIHLLHSLAQLTFGQKLVYNTSPLPVGGADDSMCNVYTQPALSCVRNFNKHIRPYSH